MRLRPYLLLLLLSLIVYLPVMHRASMAKVDFRAHINQALALPDETFVTHHVLFHAVFLSVHHSAPSLPRTDAALVAILLVMLPVPLIAFALFSKAADEKLPTAVLLALSLGLTILAPVTIWPQRHMLGYLNPIVYHNATNITSRLFVIPLSLLALRIFQAKPYDSLNQRVYIVLLSASVVLLITLAKPSFTFALLPGCCLLALWRVFRSQRVDWILLICGICLPGILLMGLLFLLTYFNQSSDSSVAFGFLTFMKEWIPTWRIPIQFLLSLVFPLAVFALYFEQARRNLYLNMCWLIFAVGAAVAYFMYEDGRRIMDGNFIWSSYNAIFLLMFASLLFLIKQHARESQRGSSDLALFGIGVSRRVALATLALALHILSGIAYWYRFTTQY